MVGSNLPSGLRLLDVDEGVRYGGDGASVSAVFLVVVCLLAVSVPVLIGIGLVRGKTASSGMAGAFGQVSEMLNPDRPRAEFLDAVREGEIDEQEDERNRQR